MNYFNEVHTSRRISLQYILILSSYLSLRLRMCLYITGYWSKCWMHLSRLIRVICPVLLILLDSITFWWNVKYMKPLIM